MNNETRHALRALLKAVDKHLTRVAGNTQWRDEIVTQSRVPIVNELDRQHRLSLMQDMLFWIHNIQEHTVMMQGRRHGGLHACSQPPAAPLCMRALGVKRIPLPPPHPIQSLLKRYNIGKDADDRNKEMVAAVAKRVGFKLPESPEDEPSKPAVK
jgi:hypothetical protein